MSKRPNFSAKTPERKLTPEQHAELRARIMYQDVMIGIDVWGEKMEFRVSVLAKEQADAIREQLLEMAKRMI